MQTDPLPSIGCRLTYPAQSACVVGSGRILRSIIHSFRDPISKTAERLRPTIVIVPEDAPQTDPDLIALVADARRWVRELLDGHASSIQEITERERLRSGSVSRILPLAWLAPDITTAILEGRQPPNLTAKSLRSLPELPLNWTEQHRILGFSHL